MLDIISSLEINDLLLGALLFGFVIGIVTISLFDVLCLLFDFIRVKMKNERKKN